MSLTSEAKKEVERLLRLDQKLNAIKYLQSTFNISLSEANTLVEVVEHEQSAIYTAQEMEPATVSTTALEGDLKASVINLLQANKKIEAVKLVKTNLNTGLKEALVLVEEVHKEIDPNYRSVQVGSGCLGGTFKLFGLLFGGISLLLLSIAGIIYYYQSKSIGHSEIVQGEVTELIYSNEGGTAPRITYQWKGEKRTYQSNTYSTPPAYEIKEKVQLYVNRDDPSDVLVDTFSDRWLLITIIGGIGFVFMLFTIAFWLASGKIKA